VNRAQFQITWTVIWFTPVILLLFWVHVIRRLRRFEEDSRREAIKRTDPKMNVLADELETAKSVKGDENENDRKSERQVLR